MYVYIYIYIHILIIYPNDVPGIRAAVLCTPQPPEGNADAAKLVALGFPSGIIRSNWNDTEKISMAPAQG